MDIKKQIYFQDYFSFGKFILFVQKKNKKIFGTLIKENDSTYFKKEIYELWEVKE